MCFSIIELLFFRSAARTHLHSCLSFFVVTPGKRWRLKVLFFACLTCVCERCTKSARHLTWCDGLASPMDCVTSLCKHESPGSSLISFASQERSFGTHFVFCEWLMLLTVLQLAVQFFWSSLFQRCYTGVYRNVNVFPQSTCLQQISFMSSELSWAILSQTVWLIWCIPLSEGGDKSRAASRNRSFLNPMDVEVTAAFNSRF